MFQDLNLDQSFVIVRPLVAIVGNKEDHENLKPRAPYQPRKRGTRDIETTIVAGPPPAATRTVKWVTRLPDASIPKNVASILLDGDPPEETAGNLQVTILPPRVTPETYGRHFQTLLWVEEFRMQYVHLCYHPIFETWLKAVMVLDVTLSYTTSRMHA